MARGPRRTAPLATLALTAACAGPDLDPATDATVATAATSPGGSLTSPESAATTTADPGDRLTSDESTGATSGDATSTGADACPDPAPCPSCACVAGAWSCACPPSAPEAGFVTIEAVDYALGLGPAAIPLRSTPARLFYALQPADPGAEAGPLFVLWNGGPAVSTGLLLATNTGRQTAAQAWSGGPPLAPNPAAWTRLGHLLYIDARGAGLSYGLLDGAQAFDARLAAMQTASFNTYLDAADFVRVLLAVMDAHPGLRAAPVVLVAESYGAIRAGVVLDMLLRHPTYGDGTRHYQDPALVEAIADHLALRFPDADAFPPALVAEQFGRQVLIQPSVAGKAQEAAAGALFDGPASPMHALAAELGLTFTPCAAKPPPCDPYDNGLAFVKSAGRSGYDTRAPTTWLSHLFADVAASLGDPEVLAGLLGVELPAVAGLAAAERPLGPLAPFRLVSEANAPADPHLPDLLGPLAPWDRYFMTWSYEANIAFRSGLALSLDVDPGDPHHGVTFLRNLLDVDTLITDAADDVVIYGPSIAPTLASYPAIVADVEPLPDHPEGAARPGALRVTYAPGAFGDLEAGVTRTIRLPRYAPASHAVTLDQPGALLADVEAWLAE